MVRRIPHSLPILGILAALILYLYSASLYSAATSLDLAHGGYHHLQNYWCDLLVPVTYTGQPNPGRGWGLAATGSLVATLFFFWFSVTTLFLEYALLALFIRIAGAIAVIAGSLIFTPLHNFVITVAAPLGFLAVIATCVGLARKQHWPILALGIIAVGIAIFDYALWKFALLKPHQPLIQKLAFALIFTWVLAAALKALRFPTRKIQLTPDSPSSIGQ